MESILLIVSSTRMSYTSVDHAMRICRAENKPITAAFILDSDLAKHIFDQLTMEGYIGDEPGKRIHDAVMQEYEIRGMAMMEEICIMAKDSGVECNTLYRKGNFLQNCREILSTMDIDRVVITRRKRSNLSRFIFGSAIDELMHEFNKVVFEVFEEED